MPFGDEDGALIEVFGDGFGVEGGGDDEHGEIRPLGLL